MLLLDEGRCCATVSMLCKHSNDIDISRSFVVIGGPCTYTCTMCTGKLLSLGCLLCIIILVIQVKYRRKYLWYVENSLPEYSVEIYQVSFFNAHSREDFINYM